ncbi:MAG: M15 family metallopeptidase [bacterium]
MAIRVAASSASLLLPHPPAPVSVTKRDAPTSCSTSASSEARPTKLLSAVGTFPTVTATPTILRRTSRGWPIAIDINPTENPYQSESYWRRYGMKTQFREIAPIARKHGLGWGGDWGANGGAVDPMHFTAATNEGGKVKAETYDPKLADAARKAFNAAVSGSPTKPAAVPSPPPKKPGTTPPAWQKGWKVFKYPPVMRGENIRVWQQRMRERGWDIVADGVYGPRSATVAHAFQREHRPVIDGIVGLATWRAAWESPIR